MGDVLVINARTGERVHRDFTPEERAQREADVAASLADREAADAKAAADAVARDAAIAHAKSLGFTDDMIAVMYPGLAS